MPNQVRLLTRRVTKTSGQVTVPVDFRKRWGLSGKEVYVADLGGMIVIIPPMVARQGLPGEAKLREIADSLALGMNNNGN
ncbi:MAG: AbrB/MazE/SpoVT family DNA-binding domain-containing protein [Propionibacteriaceae bacterium]|nr:AbrB/MazE/SpoVT family DNA-binding domain-containing protein [Propionibacteriaceae bacterium]